MSISLESALEVAVTGNLLADSFYLAAEEADTKKVNLDPPRDADAERWILAAVLSGQFHVKTFPLTARDFQVPFHRILWVAAECVEGAKLPMTLGRICMALQALGNGPAERHVERVADLVGYAPFRIREDGEVARVIEMSKRKALLRWARQFSAKVRQGAYTAAQARAHLRKVGARA